MTNATHADLRARIEAVAAESALLQLSFRAMFGGQMLYHTARPLGSLAEQGLSLKLSEADRAALLREPGAQYLQHDGEAPSKVYVVVPSQIIADDDQLRDWLERAATYVMTLPAPKPRKGKSAS
jgi:TfoX/Sxy family transcriptional regulator of competence genes